MLVSPERFVLKTQVENETPDIQSFEARLNRLPEVWPILEAGRSLEPVSDCRPISELHE